LFRFRFVLFCLVLETVTKGQTCFDNSFASSCSTSSSSSFLSITTIYYYNIYQEK